MLHMLAEKSMTIYQELVHQEGDHEVDLDRWNQEICANSFQDPGQESQTKVPTSLLFCYWAVSSCPNDVTRSMIFKLPESSLSFIRMIPVPLFRLRDSKILGHIESSDIMEFHSSYSADSSPHIFTTFQSPFP